MSAPPPRERIFVSIAAYRDAECQWTVRDLFAAAAHPERISVGIVWQLVPGEDDHMRTVRTHPERCREIVIDAHEARGVCWARHLAQGLWQGEDYYLQIDAHMRFEPGWDEALIEMLAACPSDKAVLSTYPPGYVPPDARDAPLPTLLAPMRFLPDGVLMLHGVAMAPDSFGTAPRPHMFIAAGFLFARAGIISEVPYDPHLYFNGEEATLAVRLWTHGWDLFAPPRVVLYHWYARSGTRPLHHEDNGDWLALQQRAYARVAALLGMADATPDEALVEIERYGLGSARTLAAFQEAAGIDFRAQRIDGGATPAESPEDAARRRRQAFFGDVYRTAAWGDDETRSGGGATRAETRHLVATLPALAAELGIASLLDVGCGELNWMAEISDTFGLYLGMDIVPDVVADLRARFDARSRHAFVVGDGFADPLPAVDAILCKDVLSHYPLDAVVAAIRHFVDAGPRYLLLGTVPGAANADAPFGTWRVLDLCAAPIGLPPPRRVVPVVEGAAKSIGVWHRDDLAAWAARRDGEAVRPAPSPAPAAAPAVRTDNRALIAAVAAKTLVFTVTAGRTGTAQLARLFGQLDGVTSLHEGTPDFVDAMRPAQADPEEAMRFLLARKLPRIADDPNPVVVETSHLFGKGFLGPMVALGIRPALVLLRRAPRAVAWSYVQRAAVPGRTEPGLQYALAPTDPGVLPLPGWPTLDDYALCYWHALEMERRQAEAAMLQAGLGRPWIDVTIEEACAPDRFRRMLAALGLAGRMSAAGWTRFAGMAWERHNATPDATPAPHALAVPEAEVWRRVTPFAPLLRARIAERYAPAAAARGRPAAT